MSPTALAAPVFADTFFYLALLGRDAMARRRAEDAAAALAVSVVTTSFVLLEVANSLAAPNHRGFYTALAILRDDPDVSIVSVTEELFTRGEVLYADHHDKGWSLTDCVSFVVMRDRGMTDALTADRHFEQAGFTALLRP